MVADLLPCQLILISGKKDCVDQKIYGAEFTRFGKRPLRKTKSLAVLLKVAAIALTQGRNRCVLVQP